LIDNERQIYPRSLEEAPNGLPTGGEIAAIVDEDGLPNGNAGGVGDIPGEEKSVSGTLPGGFGPDGAGSFSFAGLDGTQAVLGTETIDLTWDAAGHTLTGNGPRGDLFEITVDPATGAYTFTLLDNVLHAPGADENDAAIDLAYTVTDGNGDSAPGKITITVDDDTPIASVTPTGAAVIHDETAGAQGDANDVTTQPASFAAFESANGVVAIGWAVSPGAVVSAAASAMGADGAGASPSYALTIPSAGVDSGVDTTDGKSIFLFQEGDLVVGRVGNGETPDVSGAIAFAVSIDAAIGIVSVGQYLSLEHPVGGSSYDEAIALAGGAIQAVVTVTDGDGDGATASVNIGAKISFQDDGPCQFDPEDRSLANAAGATVSGDLDIAGHTGADGFGAIAFANITDGQVALGSIDGVTKTLKCGGETIYLFTSADDTVLTGTTDPAGKDAGDVVFTLALNGAGDSYSFNLVKPIDNGAGLVFDYFGNAGAGNNRWVGIFTDGNAPSGGDANAEDLLLTPINAKYVNTSSTDIGVDNQHINAGEGVRIDFVTDVNGDQKTTGAFTYTDHFLVTDSIFRIAQVQGSDSSDAVVRVRAYDADNDNTMSGDAGDVIVPLSLDGLVVKDAAGAVVEIGTHGIEAYQVGGDIVIDGLKEGYSVEVKSDTPYDRLEITNAAGLDIDSGRCSTELDGKAFEISTVSVIETATGGDIALHYDTALSDGDHDQIVSSDGIDLALLAGGATAVASVAAESDLSAAQQSAEPDGAAPALFAAASLADDANDHGALFINAGHDGNPVTFGSGGEAQDLWAAVQLDYNAITPHHDSDGGLPGDLSGDLPGGLADHHAHAIGLGEVLDNTDGAASAHADADTGVLALDHGDTNEGGDNGHGSGAGHDGDIGAPAFDPQGFDTDHPAPEHGGAAGTESLADTAFGDLVPFFTAPSVADQVADDQITPAL
ncbi:MAG: DUF5801 repeats-in-toxin domain-containing protein, partial [Dongiaceae bacterium]